MNTRSTTERRTRDRRQVDYEFGSPRWVKHMKLNYFAWPKQDRRQSTRRTSKRREAHPGTLRVKSTYRFTTSYANNLLTRNEKLFFDKLFKPDNNDNKH